MRKPDASGVQEIALEDRKVARARPQAARRAIERVSDDWMTDRREVRPDLVRAPRVDHDFNQGTPVQTGDHAPIGSRVAAFVPACGHSRSAPGIA